MHQKKMQAVFMSSPTTVESFVIPPYNLLLSISPREASFRKRNSWSWRTSHPLKWKHQPVRSQRSTYGWGTRKQLQGFRHDGQTRFLPLEMLSLLPWGYIYSIYLFHCNARVTSVCQTWRPGAKSQCLGKNIRTKRCFLLYSPSTFVIKLQLSKKNPFLSQIREIFLTFPIKHLSVRSSCSIVNEVVSERSRLREPLT